MCELDLLTHSLGSDDQVIFDNLDFAPNDRIVIGRQTAKVLELTVLGNLTERGSIRLTDGDKVTTLVRPAPRATALTHAIAKLLVRLEVVQVDVLAFVRLIGIALDSLNAAILALNFVLIDPFLGEAIPLFVVVGAGSTLLGPGSLRRLVSAYQNLSTITLTSLPFIMRSMTSPEA